MVMVACGFINIHIVDCYGHVATQNEGRTHSHLIYSTILLLINGLLELDTTLLREKKSPTMSIALSFEDGFPTADTKMIEVRRGGEAMASEMHYLTSTRLLCVWGLELWFCGVK